MVRLLPGRFDVGAPAPVDLVLGAAVATRRLAFRCRHGDPCERVVLERVENVAHRPGSRCGAAARACARSCGSTVTLTGCAPNASRIALPMNDHVALLNTESVAP